MPGFCREKAQKAQNNSALSGARQPLNHLTMKQPSPQIKIARAKDYGSPFEAGKIRGEAGGEEGTVE
jgi:hypothetical protein